MCFIFVSFSIFVVVVGVVVVGADDSRGSAVDGRRRTGHGTEVRGQDAAKAASHG